VNGTVIQSPAPAPGPGRFPASSRWRPAEAIRHAEYVKALLPRATMLIGSLLMLAGVLVWLFGTPSVLMTGARATACEGASNLLACGVGGPLLVAAGFVLVRRWRGVLLWLMLAFGTYFALQAAGAIC
jgi:hypothetical protein